MTTNKNKNNQNNICEAKSVGGLGLRTRFANWNSSHGKRLILWERTAVFQYTAIFIALLTCISLVYSLWQIREDLEFRSREQVDWKRDQVDRAWSKIQMQIGGNTGKGDSLSYLLKNKTQLDGVDLTCKSCANPPIFNDVEQEYDSFPPQFTISKKDYHSVGEKIGQFTKAAQERFELKIRNKVFRNWDISNTEFSFKDRRRKGAEDAKDRYVVFDSSKAKNTKISVPNNLGLRFNSSDIENSEVRMGGGKFVAFLFTNVSGMRLIQQHPVNKDLSLPKLDYSKIEFGGAVARADSPPQCGEQLVAAFSRQTQQNFPCSMKSIDDMYFCDKAPSELNFTEEDYVIFVPCFELFGREFSHRITLQEASNRYAKKFFSD